MSQALDQQLASLKGAALQQSASYQTSRDQLHQAIVEAYLWWRTADAQSGYLDATYKAAGIKTRKRGGNSPNFYPLVRLIWNIDVSKQAGTVSNWARSLLALHEEYTKNPNLYAANATADLINYIKDKGGLGAIRGEPAMTADELAKEESAGIAQETRGRPKLSAPPPATVVKSKLLVAKSISPVATLPSFPTAVTNNDDLVVMLGRRNAAGEIEIVGSNYDDNLIQAALDGCTALDRSSVTPSLRLIAEALEPHALPAKLEKYRKKFFDDSAIKRTVTLQELDEDDTPQIRQELVKQATRLRYRPHNNDFLVSKAIATASLVTMVRPHNQFNCKDEVILRGEDRSWIERELLNQQKLSLYTATPDFGLLDETLADKVRFSLNIEDKTQQHSRTLYFYSNGSVPAETNQQPTIKQEAALTWDWQLEVQTQWLAEFDAQCATPYINKIRGFFKRRQYASLQLQVSKDAMEIRYWYEDGVYAYNYSLPYNSIARRTDKKPGTELFPANAKDLALVFAVLPTLPITSSNVLLAGNDHVMRVTYSTDLADYETYIPAADTAGQRDDTAFEMYGG